MKRICCLILAVLCLALAGCGNLGTGTYANVTPHREENTKSNPEDVNAAVYWQLHKALTDLVESGAESGLIYVAEYNQSKLEPDLAEAIQKVTQDNPIGAYAVEEVRYELGTSSGKSAVAVEISYLHDRTQIRRIQRCDTLPDAREAIGDALDECESSLVLQIGNYQQTDFVQMVQDYANENPGAVMEVPEVAVGIYPEQGGANRVVELKFSYQTSRDVLRNMQSQVRPVFDAAVLYVSGDGEDREKLGQLYAFLMERFDYQVETSITPAYSLLRHGVGDSKAFAMVYAAMCRNAGLECQTVSGTRNGEAWYWNIVRDGENYFHVDLLASNEQGAFQEWGDEEMAGYVWDYSAYPVCGEQPEPTEPTEDVTEATEGNE